MVRDGEIVHLAGYGEAGPADRPVTPDTPFIIGSSSKPFTALVVQQLVAEGRLSLDEAVAPHLQTVTGTVPNGFEDATVGQLLNHTGGLSMMVGLAGTVDVHRGDDALERRVRELMAQQLASQPGGDFEYSNAGAQLLAAVTEQVTGRPFAQSLQDRVFDPLGMDRSFAREDDPTAADLAAGHARWFGRWRPADFPYDEAGVAMGYIGSTARDLAAFVRAHLDGHPSVPATADRIAQERVVPTDWDLPLEGGYGLGWFVDEHAGRQVVSHSGSLGHFTAHLIMVPEERLGVAVLSNASAFVANGHEGQYDLSLGITDLLLDRQPTPTEPSALMALAAPGAVWAMVVAVFLAALHQVVRRFPRWRRERRAGAAPRWLRRVVVPAAGWITAAAVLFVAVPLDSGRHFYPDVGWGATVLAFLCLGWAAVRTILTVAALRRPRREGEEDRRSRVGDPQAGMRDSRHHALRAAVTDIVRMRSLRKPRASRSSRRAGQPRPVHTGLGRGTSRR